GDVHHRLWQSRPSRGVVARRREGGAGCGTRERGQRKPRPRAASGSPPGAQRLPAAVRLAVNAKAVMPRGAPHGETHRYSASDPQATGHPGAIREDLRVIQVTRRFGAPFPSLGGRKTGGTTGEPLRLHKNRGRFRLRCLTIEYVSTLSVRPRESGGPGQAPRRQDWVPACAGASGQRRSFKPRPLTRPGGGGGEPGTGASGARGAGPPGAPRGGGRGLAHKWATNEKSPPRRSSFSNSE